MINNIKISDQKEKTISKQTEVTSCHAYSRTFPQVSFKSSELYLFIKQEENPLIIGFNLSYNSMYISVCPLLYL